MLCRGAPGTKKFGNRIRRKKWIDHVNVDLLCNGELTDLAGIKSRLDRGCTPPVTQVYLSKTISQHDMNGSKWQEFILYQTSSHSMKFHPSLDLCISLQNRGVGGILSLSFSTRIVRNGSPVGICVVKDIPIFRSARIVRISVNGPLRRLCAQRAI